MRIGLGQIDIKWEDKQKNKGKCLEYLDKSRQAKIDLILFPEMTLTGFSMNIKQIGESNHESLEWFRDKAKEFDLHIGFGYVEKIGDKGINKYVIISSTGQVLSEYSKIHPFSFGEEDKYFESGTNIVSTQINDICLSTFICYDLRFPEIFQVASKNSHLIIVAANWPKVRRNHWITLLKARAIENQYYIAGVNRTGFGNGIEYIGDSLLISPTGDIISAAGEEEILIIGQINKKNVNVIRKDFNLKKDRKEDLYIDLYQKGCKTYGEVYR